MFIIFFYHYYPPVLDVQASNVNLASKLQLFFEFHKFYATFLNKNYILVHYFYFSACKVIILSGFGALNLDIK